MKPSLYLFALSFAAAAVMPAVAAPADTVPAAQYIWLLKAAKGDVARYRTKQHVVIPGPNGQDFVFDSNGKVREEVLSVTPAGDATMVQKVTDQEATFNGAPLPAEQAPKPITTIVRTPAGMIKKSTIENAQMGTEKLQAMLGMLATTPAPLKATKAGETWTTELDNALLTGKKTTMKSTLVGAEKVAGIDTVRVKFTMSIAQSDSPDPGKAVMVTGGYNVDPKNGRMMRGDYKFENAMLEFQGTPITIKGDSTIELIVPGVNDKEPAAQPTK